MSYASHPNDVRVVFAVPTGSTSQSLDFFVRANFSGDVLSGQIREHDVVMLSFRTEGFSAEDILDSVQSTVSSSTIPFAVVAVKFWFPHFNPVRYFTLSDNKFSENTEAQLRGEMVQKTPILSNILS